MTDVQGEVFNVYFNDLKPGARGNELGYGYFANSRDSEGRPRGIRNGFIGESIAG